jgi:2-phospho-L-lactate/phosphoenolpyruvate guanylyltransferase
VANWTVLVPVKSFTSAKTRLRDAGRLDAPDIAARLAEGVLRALAPRGPIVVSETDDVIEWATQRGYPTLRTRAQGLNPALHEAITASGARQVMIVHGDVARPEGLATFTPTAEVTVVTDRHGRGTNVLALTQARNFSLAFGPNSAQAHKAEAQRRGLRFERLDDTAWAVDIDEIEDLAFLPEM